MVFLVFNEGNAIRILILHTGIAKSRYPQHFLNGAFHGKNDVDENLPINKFADLTSNASALHRP